MPSGSDALSTLKFGNEFRGGLLEAPNVFVQNICKQCSAYVNRNNQHTAQQIPSEKNNTINIHCFPQSVDVIKLGYDRSCPEISKSYFALDSTILRYTKVKISLSKT